MIKLVVMLMLRNLSKLLKKEWVYLLILSIFIFLSAKAVLHTGFFRTIDDITTVRILYMLKEFSRIDLINNFPIRWSGELSHGYGYPLYLFYAPLTYYIGAILMKFFGLSHIVATKGVYIFPLIFGPLGFYWAARKKLDQLPALVGVCFYTLFPFRGFDTYSRGGVGEAWAMAFLPFMMGGIFLMEKNNKLGGVIFSFFLFLSIISHNLSGMLILGFAILYGLVFQIKNKGLWLFLILGMGMGIFFWLPSLYYLPIVKVTYSHMNTGQILNFLEPFSKFITVELPVPREARFSGIFFYIYLIGFVIWAVYKPQKNKKFFFFWGIFGLFLFFILSEPLVFFWKATLPISRILQFPWRDLILLSFALPFFTSISISLIKTPPLRYAAAFIMIAVPLIFLPTFKPKEYSYFYEYKAEDTGACATSWGDEYLPLWVKECASNPAQKTVLLTGKADLKMIKDEPANITASIHTKDKTDVIVNKYFFPGWKFLVDGKEIPINHTFSKNGIIKGSIPTGDHNLHIYYSKTPLILVSDLISLLSMIIFISVTTTFFMKKNK